MRTVMAALKNSQSSLFRSRELSKRSTACIKVTRNFCKLQLALWDRKAAANHRPRTTQNSRSHRESIAGALKLSLRRRSKVWTVQLINEKRNNLWIIRTQITVNHIQTRPHHRCCTSWNLRKRRKSFAARLFHSTLTRKLLTQAASPPMSRHRRWTHRNEWLFAAESEEAPRKTNLSSQ